MPRPETGQFDRHRYQKSPVWFYFCADEQNPEVPVARFCVNLESIRGGAIQAQTPLARSAARNGSIDPTSAQTTLKAEYLAKNRADRLAYQGRTPSP